MYTEVPWSRVREVNVAATQALFRVAAGEGIRRAVFLSSVAVYGDPGRSVSEESSIESPLHATERYALSKREAERVVRAVAREAGMSVAILRPAAIYGERDRVLTPALWKALRLPVHLMLGGGRTPLAMIYAGNVAAAVISGLSGEVPRGARAYNLATDHELSQRRLCATLARELGIAFHPLSVPRGLVLGGAKLGSALGLRIPGREGLTLRRAARLAVLPNPYQSRRIREELGWSPMVSLEEALHRTAMWMAQSAAASPDHPPRDSV
jgi:nucleoside-diphosphate-sugar epimerase